MKQCCHCKIEKDDTDFTSSQLNKNSSKCKACVSTSNKKWKAENTDKVSLYNKQYALDNKEEILIKKQIYREENKELISLSFKKWYYNNQEEILDKNRKVYADNPEKSKEQSKKWRLENPEKAANGKKKWALENAEKVSSNNKRWKQENKDHINIYNNERYANDPVFRIGRIASTAVYQMMVSQGGSKKGGSSLDHFPWTVEQLWEHMISQFSLPENLDHNGKVWMHENNQGVYDPKSRNEQDSRTWTWQMDHIIPHSDLPYDSMSHENFKIAWSLENLRPLESKQNILDGTRRTRHKKKSNP